MQQRVEYASSRRDRKVCCAGCRDRSSDRVATAALSALVRSAAYCAMQLHKHWIDQRTNAVLSGGWLAAP